jgi:hypothetical protein
MKVTIRKHFGYLTPFSEASNDEELEEIMRLKYPQACSGLETKAEFFAKMVEEVRQYEAWRVIGFSSFEDFCREELGKTIEEVESICHGVKVLLDAGHTGNIPEKEAKEASKAAKIRELRASNPEMSNADIARQVGCYRSHVTYVQKNMVPQKKLNKSRLPKIRLTLDPALTARNIIAKMGQEYAEKLAHALLEK